jgi:dihydroxyacetone kinase-like predicted kinase
MREQHSHIIEEVEKKPMAIVAVAEGDGLRDIFLEFEVDGIVSGGQSMNPSAEDILKEIEKAPSDHIIVLPNNKNIILAAEQAGKMTKKNVVVIPSRSFPQGLSAILVFDPSAPFEQNTERMNDALATVKSGQITRAVRDTSINGDTITEGEVLGIMNGDISVHGNDVKQTFVSLIDKMVEDGDSVISIYYGKEINEASAKEIASLIEQKYVDCDVEVYSGKQPVYDYILSVE